MNGDERLTVIGAGSYGTALAIAVAKKGVKVMLYGRDKDKTLLMGQLRENQEYLRNIKFPESMSVSYDLKEAMDFATYILVVVPSSAFSATMRAIKPYMASKHLAFATKGLEHGSARFLSDVALEIMEGGSVCALSGPTFARELALGMPTAIACAGNDHDLVFNFCSLMHTKTFRVYESHDLIALQIGGAVKNVFAIGAGMSDGLGFGANARTALISRGLAEMIRLGQCLGASERGFMGLSGLGDLMLTCTDNQSRNRRLGFMVGQGMDASEAIAKIGQVVEGHHMVLEVLKLARENGIEMPICHEIYEVLYNNKAGVDAAKTLLEREMTSE